MNILLEILLTFVFYEGKITIDNYLKESKRGISNSEHKKNILNKSTKIIYIFFKNNQIDGEGLYHNKQNVNKYFDSYNNNAYFYYITIFSLIYELLYRAT